MKLIPLWEADSPKAYALWNTFQRDENGFVNNAYGLSLEGFKRYIETCEGYSRSIGLPEGYVPASVYILEAEGAYVGIFNLRHRLNESLAHGSGHIGYGITPNCRGCGFATEGLRLTVEAARQRIPEKEVYLHVHKDNPASLRVQLKNGAYIHHEDEANYYTRIRLYAGDRKDLP